MAATRKRFRKCRRFGKHRWTPWETGTNTLTAKDTGVFCACGVWGIPLVSIPVAPPPGAKEG